MEKRWSPRCNRASVAAVTQVASLNFSLQGADLLSARATANRFDPHLHGTHSVVVLKSGAAEIRSERWHRTVRAGDVFFFNPYEVHGARCLGEGADYATLYPSRTLIDRCIVSMRDEGPLQIETDVLPRGPETLAMIDALSAAQIDPDAVEAALTATLSACSFAPDASRTNARSLARKACHLIRENGMRAIRTEDLARQLGVHKSHLVRAFTAAIGLAPQTYIRQVRVAKARELICAGAGLSDIAQRLDFCDQAHLTREFKKVFGVPPGVLSRGIGKRAGSRRK